MGLSTWENNERGGPHPHGVTVNFVPITTAGCLQI